MRMSPSRYAGLIWSTVSTSFPERMRLRTSSLLMSDPTCATHVPPGIVAGPYYRLLAIVAICWHDAAQMAQPNSQIDFPEARVDLPTSVLPLLKIRLLVSDGCRFAVPWEHACLI